jgi:translation initiation factor IF-2
LSEEQVGIVRNFFSRISVAAIEITGDSLNIGDTVRVKGAGTDFIQKVESMEIDRKPIQKAEKGMAVGIKIGERTRPGDLVFKVT